MRAYRSSAPAEPAQKLQTIQTLLPYLWDFRWRLIAALSCLIMAKIASVSVPLYLKEIVDQLSIPASLLAIPMMALLGYGVARMMSGVLGEFRDAIFAKVTQGAVKKVASSVFEHLFSLSLRFHLNRQTGGMSRDIERGTKGIGFLLNFTIFNILPTLIEIVLVAVILLVKYNIWITVVTLGTIVIYITFTLVVTEWRTVFRRSMNELDSKANSKAIDALINYETVKYFNNEAWEQARYQKHLGEWEASAIKNQVSLSLLNAGQATIIAVGITLVMWLAADGVVNHAMTVGDVVLVATYLTQLWSPLHFLGFVYREIRHALADMEKMFGLLKEPVEVLDIANPLFITNQLPDIQFDNVSFAYESNRPILKNVSFTVPAGKTIAVVGASGAGKSTLSRLLYRFYDIQSGSIKIDGIDIRQLAQTDLRKNMGIVPQDTVLFNDSIYYNIAYGNVNASESEVIGAAKSAHIHVFVTSLPNGYQTTVGERGLKLSGGEKQRVAIARTILKNPSILIFDEATSALDSKTEKSIQNELKAISAQRTTLVIAHRLSTIIDADEIIVLDQGQIIEKGTHTELLKRHGCYAEMWKLQLEMNENQNILKRSSILS